MLNVVKLVLFQGYSSIQMAIFMKENSRKMADLTVLG